MLTQLSLTATDYVVCLVTLVASMLLGLWLACATVSREAATVIFWQVAS